MQCAAIGASFCQMSGIPALQPPPSLVNCVAWVPWTTSLTSWVALWLTFSNVRLQAPSQRVSSLLCSVSVVQSLLSMLPGWIEKSQSLLGASVT